MLKIGLTGGIGSGKSIISKIFHSLGIPIWDADAMAKYLLATDETIKGEITHIFGQEVYLNNQLNRQFLAEKVFNNPALLAQLNSILHPKTISAAKRWFEAQKAPYCIKEAAILFEAGSAKDLNFVIGVDAPILLRIKRVKKRDNISIKAIRARMQRQMDNRKKMKLCDFKIINNDKQLIIPQVLKLHKLLLAKAL